MRAWLSLSLVVASVFAPILFGAQAVEAQGARVVVERFRGPRGSNVRRDVVRDLENNGVQVVDEDEERRARRELGFGRRLDPEEVVELARALNASVIVQGIVRRRRRRWSATVRVLNGFDGESLGDARWRGRTASALRAVRRQAFERLGSYLSQGRAPGAVAAAVPQGGEVPWYQREDHRPEESPPDEEEEEDDEPRAASTRYDGIRFSFMVGTLYRSMDSTVTVYAAQRGLAPADPSAEFMDETRRYASGGIGHPELGGRVELYPGAFDETQSFPYLGAVVQFTHSAAVSSNGFDRMTGEPITVPTDQLELFFGLRARYRLGEERHEPELHLEAGWGMFNFNLGLPELQRIELDTIIPPMQHGFVQLSGGVDVGVAAPYLYLGAEIGGRVGTNIGGDTRNVWGTTTSPSNGFLIGANVRVEIPDLFDTFFIGLNVHYFMFSTAFSGQVGCAVADECAAITVPPWEDRTLWEVWPVVPPAGGELDIDAVVGGPSGDVVDNYVRLQLAIGAGFN